MEKLPRVSDETPAEAPTWVAPRESITAYSIAEFTQNFVNPGDDGLGFFTQS